MTDSFKTFNIMIDGEHIAWVHAITETDAANYAHDHFGKYATVSHTPNGTAILD